jgi:hypothetical protein
MYLAYGVLKTTMAYFPIQINIAIYKVIVQAVFIILVSPEIELVVGLVTGF